MAVTFSSLFYFFLTESERRPENTKPNRLQTRSCRVHYSIYDSTASSKKNLAQCPRKKKNLAHHTSRPFKRAQEGKRKPLAHDSSRSSVHRSTHTRPRRDGTQPDNSSVLLSRTPVGSTRKRKAGNVGPTHQQPHDPVRVQITHRHGPRSGEGGRTRSGSQTAPHGLPPITRSNTTLAHGESGRQTSYQIWL